MLWFDFQFVFDVMFKDKIIVFEFGCDKFILKGVVFFDILVFVLQGEFDVWVVIQGYIDGIGDVESNQCLFLVCVQIVQCYFVDYGIVEDCFVV